MTMHRRFIDKNLVLAHACPQQGTHTIYSICANDVRSWPLPWVWLSPIGLKYQQSTLVKRRNLDKFLSHKMIEIVAKSEDSFSVSTNFLIYSLCPALLINSGPSKCTIERLTHLNEYCHLKPLYSQLYCAAGTSSAPVERGIFSEWSHSVAEQCEND